MAEPSGRSDAHAATLAAALFARARLLADVATETSERIERDRTEIAGAHQGSPLADQLIDAVRARLEGIVGDTRDLAATLERFRELAGPVDLPEPPAELAEPLPELPEPLPELAEPLVHGASPSEGRLSIAKAPLGDETGAGSGGAPVSEGVRLLATQMSVAGSSVEQIEARLREDFGVEDAHAVVAELFGYPGDEQEDSLGMDPDER